jgi:hypothetical protein
VDADFLGQYMKGADAMHLDKRDADNMHLDVMTAKSRTGFIITYAGCPITWGSKIQREAALSLTESEYIAMSESFWVLLPMMNLLEEAKMMRVPMKMGEPAIHCKMFEDNSVALQRAQLPKIRPQTRT